MKRITIFSLFALLACLGALAQASFQIIPPRNAIAGRNFQVVYRLSNGEGNNPKVPNISGCELRFGPSTSTSYSTQIINGNVTSKSTVDYTYTYYAPSEGTFTIPAATIQVDGKTLTAEAKQFTVLPADQAPQGQGSAAGAAQGRQDSGAGSSSEISKDDIFVRILLNKTNVYEQEAVECTVKLYTRYQEISSFTADDPGKYEGFLIEEVNTQARLNEMEHYNGRNYLTAVLRRFILYPQKSGTLAVHSGSYEATVLMLETFRNGFFPITRTVERTVKIPDTSVSLHVKPLPQPQPQSFTGAVGNFTIDSRLSSESLRTGEAGSLTIAIKGTGNIKYLSTPEVEFPEEFEQYTPSQNNTASVSGSNMTGTMTTEFTFVPETVGKYEIKGYEFSYFNPADGNYHTLTTDSYTINVAKGAGASSGGVAQQAVKLKATDILHIHLGDKHLTREPSFLAKSWVYWAAYPVLALIFIVACLTMAKRNKKNADVTGRNKARAGKVARKRLALAEKAMKAGRREEFYDAIIKAVWGYLSDKLSIPASALTRDNISDELARYGAPEEISRNVIAVLDDCEMARYTPDEPSLSPKSIYSAASDVMNEIESIKTK